jgi:hypothetical protein
MRLAISVFLVFLFAAASLSALLSFDESDEAMEIGDSGQYSFWMNGRYLLVMVNNQTSFYIPRA